MQPEISVIVPTYNVEHYLVECLESILNQSFKDIEVIVINDGSTDSSGTIISNFTRIDNRVNAIHQSNKGYGAAVNAGLNISKGKYISIVEPDDWIEHEMFSILHKAAIITDCEIVKGGFRKILSNGVLYEVPFSFVLDNSTKIIRPIDNIELMLFESSIWSSLYRKDFLDHNNIRMLETPGASYQDVAWKFMTYAMCQKLLLVHKTVYNYRCFVVGSSSSNKSNYRVVFSNYTSIRHFLETKNIFDNLKNAFYLHQMFDFVFHFKRLSNQFKGDFVRQARLLLDEADQQGVKLDGIAFSSQMNLYIRNEVKPICRAIKSDWYFLYYSARLSFIGFLNSKSFLKRSILIVLRFVGINV